MTRSATSVRSPVEEAVRYAVAIGATLVLLIPAARGHSPVGWLPLWLLGMPLSAWACLWLAGRHDPASRAAVAPAGSGAVPRGRPVTASLARRRSRTAARRLRPRAA